MNTKQTMTALVLTGIALLVGATAMAADLPAQEGRMWAPTGDLIGLENHYTVGGTTWDPHGNKSKYAEDWQQEDDLLFSGLFGFHKVLDSERSITFRGYGESGRGTLASRITLLMSKPDKCRVSLDFRNFNNFYDPTSEMRAGTFGGTMPPSLTTVPSLGWRMGKFTISHKLGAGFGVDLGFNRMCKDGTKGSLLRADTGTAVPNLKSFDTTTNEILLGVGFASAKLDAKAHGAYRMTEGDRIVGDHAYTDDQTLFRVGLDATYRLSSKVSLLGMANSSKLETTNSETLGANVYVPTGEAKTTNGRLALITRLGSSTTARLTAGLGTWDTDYQTDLAGVMDKMTTRERKSTDVGLLLTNTSFKKTRLRLDYRFRSTNLQEVVTESSFGHQGIDQDRESHRANLRMGIRLGRKTTFKARVGYRSLRVDQVNAGDELFYTMGDRRQRRVSGRLALQTRPCRKMRLDFGFQGHDQSFQREDISGVKTTNNATQGFVGLNIFASDRLTFVGTGSYGLEKYEIENVSAGVGMSPNIYEGTTLRLAPGLIMQVTNRMELEAHYEAVRFEDPGDAPNEGNQLNSDLDRMLLRAGYRVGESMRISATYRRHEFDENRWDDYIMDLYSLSVSGRF